MIKHLLLLSLFPLLLFSCDGNYQDVEVNGLVSDLTTGAPVPDVKVTIKCWVYDTQSWESKALSKHALTNSAGEFSIIFEEGEALDIRINPPNYKEYLQAMTLNGNKVKVHAKLVRE